MLYEKRKTIYIRQFFLKNNMFLKSDNLTSIYMITKKTPKLWNFYS